MSTTKLAHTELCSLEMKDVKLNLDDQIDSGVLHAIRESFEQRLERIEAILVLMAQRQTVREWYTTDQVAQLLGKSEFTVREWCRLKRIRAEKRRSGRGAYASWAISHAEVLRVQREGLLPFGSNRMD